MTNQYQPGTYSYHSTDDASFSPMASKRPHSVVDDGSLAIDPYCCPVCTLHYGGKILQCVKGHCVCERCWLALAEPRLCPSCRIGMPQAVDCLFALQQARNAGNQLSCASASVCDFRGTYDQVCAHETGACLALHKHVPCLLDQVGTTLGIGWHICDRKVPEAHVYEHSLDHHADAYWRTLSQRDNLVFFSSVPMADRIGGGWFGVKHPVHGSFALVTVLQGDVLHLALIHLLGLISVVKFQVVTKHTQDDAKEGAGLRLEGQIVKAKDLLTEPIPIQLHSSAIHVHRITFQPYIRGRDVANSFLRIKITVCDYILYC